MAESKRDNNRVTTLLAVSNVDGITPVVLWADPTTHSLLTSDGGVPGGSDGQIQYNNGGVFGGAALTYDASDTDFYKVISPNAVGSDVNARTLKFIVGNGVAGDAQGGFFSAQGGNGFGAEIGGGVELKGGEGGATSTGGSIMAEAGSGGATSGSGGSISLTAGNDQDDSSGGGNVSLQAGGSSITGVAGALIRASGGQAGDGAGNILLDGGDAGSGSDSGGGIQINAGDGGATGGAGGNINLNAGQASGGDSDGGNVNFTAGTKTGSGDNGGILFQDGAGNNFVVDPNNGNEEIFAFYAASAGVSGKLDFSGLSSSDKIFTFPNTTGTLGLKNQDITSYGVGTAYSLTNTAAAIDFGTTDPVVVLSAAGTYLIMGQVNLAYAAATVVAETATIKVRRTNNTAADLSAVVVLDLPVATTLTHTYGIFQIPPFIYTTAATDDSVTLFANVSAALGAGTINATAIGTSLVAIRLY